MPYQLSRVVDEPSSASASSVSDSTVRQRIDTLLGGDATRYRRLWMYYRNPMRACALPTDEQGSERPYHQAQEWGLPSRITAVRSGLEVFSGTPVEGVARKEVVIENDITWRIDTMVDYLVGKPIVINSAAADPARRAMIEPLLRQVIALNGGIVFLQQLALLGAVYGHIDVLVKFSNDDSTTQPAANADGSVLSSQSSSLTDSISTTDLGQPPTDTHVTAGPGYGVGDSEAIAGASRSSLEAITSLARRIRFEIVEPTRALPLLSPIDYRHVIAYGQVYRIERLPTPAAEAASPARSLIERLRARFGSNSFGNSKPNDQTLVVEIVTPDKWQRYEDEKLVAEGNNSLGRVPLVHIQNTSIPFEYSGASDVEPLIPVQDEINARLSDRAYRITMQAFKMYLGKGIENFTQMPVSPGRMWLTDNPDADVIEFGGDGKTFSEDNHISEMREAMDKISGVTPIAAGAIKGRIGRLTSAAALRVTMLALLAKTERKRTAYGPAIEQMCALALEWLDRAGLFHTSPDERRIEIHWPNPVPVNEIEQLQEAQAKVQLGVPQDVVLRELGY
jgi:hypothetical protein